MTEILIDHLLFFVSNKYKAVTKDEIVNSALLFYKNFDEINDAKKLLYEKTGKAFSPRRGDDKSRTTICDIYDHFVLCDNKGIDLPVFAASDLSRIPITTDGSVTMEQVLNIINAMNQRLGSVEKCLKRPLSSVSPSTPEVTASIVSNFLPAQPDTLKTSSCSPSTSGDSSWSTIASKDMTHASDDPNRSSTASLSSNGPTAASIGSSGLPTASDDSSRSSTASGGPSGSSTASDGSRGSSTASDDGFKRPGLKQRPKTQDKGTKDGSSRQPRSRSKSQQRQTFIGKKVITGEISWGGVDLLAHRYIGNVRNDVTAKMIKDDLKGRNVDVVDVTENEVKKHTRYKSFKLTIKRGNIGEIDDPNFWPSNVIIRRWHNPRPPRDDRDGDAAAAAAIPAS